MNDYIQAQLEKEVISILNNHPKGLSRIGVHRLMQSAENESETYRTLGILVNAKKILKNVSRQCYLPLKNDNADKQSSLPLKNDSAVETQESKNTQLLTHNITSEKVLACLAEQSFTVKQLANHFCCTKEAMGYHITNLKKKNLIVSVGHSFPPAYIKKGLKVDVTPKSDQQSAAILADNSEVEKQPSVPLQKATSNVSDQSDQIIKILRQAAQDAQDALDSYVTFCCDPMVLNPLRNARDAAREAITNFNEGVE